MSGRHPRPSPQSQQAALAARLPAQPGTYVLLLACARQRQCAIGRLGRVTLQPGIYAYVGSALGPGGLRGRLKHHLAAAPRPRWHIDWLRRASEPVAVWLQASPQRQECAWATLLAERATPVASGFGSSDCHCRTHLFYLQRAQRSSLYAQL